jgi:hypothetical protein
MALALAFIDDRVYTRFDLEQAGIAPVLVEVPKPKGAGKASKPPGGEATG